MFCLYSCLCLRGICLLLKASRVGLGSSRKATSFLSRAIIPRAQGPTPAPAPAPQKWGSSPQPPKVGILRTPSPPAPKVGILASPPELDFLTYMQFYRAPWSSALRHEGKLMVFVRRILQINHGPLTRLQRKAHPRWRKAHSRGREREDPKAELELPTRLAFNPLPPPAATST